MAYLDSRTLHATRHHSGLFDLVDRFNAWRLARKSRAVLLALSDEELDDIGLSRGEVMAMDFRIDPRG